MKTVTKRPPRMGVGAVLLCALSAGGLVVIDAPARAGVVLDGSLGPAGAVAGGSLPDGSAADYLVSPDLGQRAGDSLFHSFSRFSVEAGRSAVFTAGSETGLARVIARVTGGDPSQIDGTLRSSIEGASLFLLNPAGVVFGAGATIDVPGAFHVSTADTLRFADGSSLDLASATPPALLSVAAPEAFGFRRETPAPIRFERTGVVSTPFSFFPQPWTIDLVGGDVTFDGTTLWAFRRGLSILSVGGPGFARVDDPVASAADFATLGDVTLLRGAEVSLLSADPHEIRLAADRLLLSGTSKLWGADLPIFRAPEITIDVGELSIGAGAWIHASTYGATPGGTISIHASRFVDVDGDPAARLRGSILSESESSATGAGGRIEIETEALRIHDGGRVSASTQRRGEAGDVVLRVGTLDVRDGGTVDLSDRSNDDVHGPGRLDVIARERVTIGAGSWTGADDNDLDTGLIASADVSDGGWIRVFAPEIEVGGKIGNDSDGVRRQTSAPVTLEADRIEVIGGAPGKAGAIDTGSWNDAPAGDLVIDVEEELRLVDGSIRADGFDAGTAGTIAIRGGRVVLLDAAHHSAIRAVSAKENVATAGGSNAGSIVLDVDELQMTGGTIDVGTGGTGGNGHGGRAGSIVIRARDRVELVAEKSDPEHLGLRAASRGDADGGSIRVEAPLIVLGLGMAIDATTSGAALAGAGPERQAGDAGSVVLRADTLRLEDGAQVRTAATGGETVRGDGGEIDVAARQVVLDSRARIASDSDSAGDGGDVRIRAGTLDIGGGAQITTDATSTGAPGRIEVVVDGSATLSGVGSDGTPSGLVARNDGAAVGGAITLAANRVRLEDGAEISSSSRGVGDAGSITVRAADTLALDSARITTSAPFANGGEIQIFVGRMVHLEGSEIAADVGEGQGGTILIDPVFVILESSRVAAQAGAGRGGSIRIVGDTILISPDSAVSASAGAAGIDGTVQIEGAGGDLAAEVQALPAAYLAAADLLRTRCAAEQGARGSFVSSTGGAPSAEESGWLPPPERGTGTPAVADLRRAGSTAALLIAPTPNGVGRARLLRCPSRAATSSRTPAAVQS